MSSQEIALTATPRRKKTPQGEMKTHRKEGVIPAVVYGIKKEPKSLWVARRELEKALQQAHSGNVLFKLHLEEGEGTKPKKKAADTDGPGDTVLLKTMQRDVLSGVPIHADFLRVDIHKKVDVEIPVHVSGEASGVKNQGGILEHLLHKVKVRCLPTAIPEAVTVDVTPLEIGQGTLAGDLKLPEGVELLTDKSHVVLNVVAPTKVEELTAPAAAPAATEPEVITKGKKEEGAAEGAAAPAAAAKAAAPAKQEAAPKK
ncbi:MAG: 50S ribosomal protein L25 [Elusimicrobia bacterium]|nr:50S ribosomal protein L25 [Elusimicrobiota bacterium]